MNWIVHGFSGITLGDLVAAEIYRNPGIAVSMIWACAAGVWAYLWWAVLPALNKDSARRLHGFRRASSALFVVGVVLFVAMMVGVPPRG